MDYLTLTSFTLASKKQAVIEAVEQVSEESVPMVRFIRIGVNDKLGKWIEQTLA